MPLRQVERITSVIIPLGHGSYHKLQVPEFIADEINKGKERVELELKAFPGKLGS